jgi:hypothetical protein
MPRKFLQPPKPSVPEAPDSGYIKAGHWWGKHVTAAVDTQQEEAEVDALQGDLDSALARVKVRYFSPLYHFLTVSDKSLPTEYY